MEIVDFIHASSWESLPPRVKNQARRCLLDTLGTAIGGRATDASRIIHDFGAASYGGTDATLWQDGRKASAAGAALANAMTTDALDIHDGFRFCKGHAGAAIVPACLAAVECAAGTVHGRELLTSLAIGYEVSLRAGMCLHGEAVAYHSSGAWNALGCAAVFARMLRLSAEQTLDALGIAEYFGPRSPIMRCVNHPSMVKDGSGWGAMVGVSAAQMASLGFTGRPGETVETAVAAPYWADLGTRWWFLELYFKPHAVCRWAQPAVEGVMQLQTRHAIPADRIKSVHVTTFCEATGLGTRRPCDSDAAQYSLPFAVAAALVHGTLGPEQLSGAALDDERVLRLANGLEMVECRELSALFPARRLAHVRIVRDDGETFELRNVEARWEAEAPPSDAELLEKFRWLSRVLPAARAGQLESAIWECESLTDALVIIRLLAAPADDAIPRPVSSSE